MDPPITDAQTLGQRVRRRRKALRLTQARAAGLAGVGTRVLGDIERGKPTVELGRVLQVLRVLGLELRVDARGGSAE